MDRAAGADGTDLDSLKHDGSTLQAVRFGASPFPATYGMSEDVERLGSAHKIAAKMPAAGPG